MIIGPPTVQQRKAILSVLCAGMPVCPSVDLEELSQQTTGYVGADLSALCREAAMNAIRDNKVNTSRGGGGISHILFSEVLVPPQFARRSLSAVFLVLFLWAKHQRLCVMTAWLLLRV